MSMVIDAILFEPTTTVSEIYAGYMESPKSTRQDEDEQDIEIENDGDTGSSSAEEI
jgi:hypothetical protein